MNWYYVEKGQKVGPIPEEEVKMRLEARAVDAKTLLWHEGAPDWKPLATFPAFAPLLPALEKDKPPQQDTAEPPRLSIQELRDPDEKAALTWLYVMATPVWVLLLAWIVLSFGLGLLIIGLIWFSRWIAEYISAAYIKTNAIRVSEKQLPELHKAVVACSERLGITPPDVFVLQESVWNAFASKMAGQRMVVLYSGAVDSILLKGNMAQLTWLVGHEIGHHVAGHLDWTRRMARLGGWVPWILLWYSRRAEFTCDRVALYCVGNRQASLLALANATVGAQLADKVNVQAAIQDWDAYQHEFFVKYRTIYSTHPPNLWRLRRLYESADEFGIYG